MSTSSNPLFSPVSRFILVAAAAVVVIAGMRAAEDLLTPFFLSLFIAVLCSPPFQWLKRKGCPTGVAILAIIGLIVICGFLVGAVVSSSFTSFRADLPEYQQKLQGLSSQLQQWLANIGIGFEANEWREKVNPGAVMGLVGNTLASFGNVMTNALMILLTVSFILAEEVSFSKKMSKGSKDSEYTLQAIRRFATGVNRYMAIKLMLSLLTGGIIFIWLSILGVDYAVLWALIAFLLNFIPTLGSILAAIPAVLLAAVQLSPVDAAFVAAGYIVVNTVIGNMIEPRIMGKGLDLSALVVLLSLVFWGWVLGPVGMLLSIPLTMTIKIALESFKETRNLAVMLGSGGQLEITVNDINDTSQSGSRLS